MTARKRLFGLALLLTMFGTLLVAACSDDATPTSSPTSTTSPTATAPAPIATAAMETMMPASPEDVLLIALNEQNDSGQSGWATLIASGNDTEVVLSLSEGSMSSNAVHIHTGQCGDSLGGVVHPLTDFSNGMSSSLLEGVSLDSLLTGDFAINAHNDADASVYTACGNIPAGESMATGTPTTIQTYIVSYVQPVLTIPVGTTVTWIQTDNVSHTVTSGTGEVYDGIGWDSPFMDQNDTFSHTFSETGTFPYFCRLHTNMNGTITVTDGSSGGDTSGGGGTTSGDSDLGY